MHFSWFLRDERHGLRQKGEVGKTETTQAAATSCAAFVSKMRSLDSKNAPPEQGPYWVKVCNKVSAETKKCVEGASGKDALNACLERDKETLMALALEEASKGFAAKRAAGKTITLAKFGITGTLPGESEEPIISEMDGNVGIVGGTFNCNVAEAKKTDPKTMKDGERDAKMFNPKNLQRETLADGWALTYENTGSGGANYFVTIRREIGGKGVMCSTVQATPEQQKSAVAFCKSLTK